MATQQSTADSASSTLTDLFTLKRLLIVYFVFAAVYIYAPILSVIVFSFNEGGITAPFAGFTMAAYGELFANQSMAAAITRSIQLALVVTLITTVLGTAAGLAYRYNFRGQRGLLYLIVLGIITPGVTYGIGARLFLTEILDLSRSLWLAVPVHVVCALGGWDRLDRLEPLLAAPDAPIRRDYHPCWVSAQPPRKRKGGPGDGCRHAHHLP